MFYHERSSTIKIQTFFILQMALIAAFIQTPFDSSQAAEGSVRAQAAPRATHPRRPRVSKPRAPREPQKSSAPKAQQPTEVKQLHSDFTNPDEMMEMWVTHPFPTNNPKVHPNTNLVEMTKTFMKNFREADGIFKEDLKGVDVNRRGIVVEMYRATDPDFYSILKGMAEDQFAEVTFIPDGNQVFNYKFTDNQISTSDFGNATFKNNVMGKGVRDLLLKEDGHDAEFSMVYPGHAARDPRYQIFSQVLWSKKKHEPDIYHVKLILFIIFSAEDRTKPEKIFLLASTGNLTPEPRYNRMFLIKDQALNREIYEHSKLVRQNFANGGAIKDIPAFPVLREDFKDGKSTLQWRFTDGKYDPNEDIENALADATKDKSKFPILKIVLSHFVSSDGQFFDNLEALLKTQIDFKVLGTFDKNFADTDSWGHAPIIMGYPSLTPAAGLSWPFPPELISRFDIHIYEKPIPGLPEANPLGEPNYEIYHDKSTEIEYGNSQIETVGGRTENVPGYYVDWLGSFNLSHHFESEEYQMMIRFMKDSALAKAIEDSIVIPMGTEPEFSLPANIGMFRISLSRMIHHSVFDMPLQDVQKVYNDIEQATKKDTTDEAMKLYQSAADKIVELAAMKSQVTKWKPGPGMVRSRLQTYLNIIKWYENEPAFAKNGKIDPQRFISLVLTGDEAPSTAEVDPRKTVNQQKWQQTHERTKAKDVRELLDYALGYPEDIQDADANRLVDEAEKMLDFASWEMKAAPRAGGSTKGSEPAVPTATQPASAEEEPESVRP